MINPNTDRYPELREAVSDLCERFGNEYWRKLDDSRDYPETFVRELTDAGWLSALIPEEYGGTGLGMAEASVILEQINRCGGNAGACHAQMYTMGTILRHGSAEQKEKFLPKIACGDLRMQAFGVTEPSTGSDTTKLRTRAVRKSDHYEIHGEKVWTSRVQHSDLMLLLARTTPLDEVKKKSEGLSAFLIDLREAPGSELEVIPIQTMMNHETNQVFFSGLRVPQENLIGEEGKGFKYILDGMNAERTLIAAECIGDGYWFIDRAVTYAGEREVFGRPIGKNQGIQFPIARAYVNLRSADLMRYQAADLFDQGIKSGTEANMAKMLAADASWEAANVALQTHGGFGFARDFDIERKFRETRLYQVAPISTNLILSFVAEHVLGLPRSY